LFQGCVILFLFRIPIDQSGLLCSGRGILVTFIIIVLIILSAAIAVGIVFNDIKSDSTKSEKTNNEVSCIIVFFLFE